MTYEQGYEQCLKDIGERLVRHRSAIMRDVVTGMNNMTLELHYLRKNAPEPKVEEPAKGPQVNVKSPLTIEEVEMLQSIFGRDVNVTQNNEGGFSL